MENPKNQWIFISLNVTFIMLAYKLSYFLQHLMQTQFNLPYSKFLSSLFFLIIISYSLAAIPFVLIKCPRIKKREFCWPQLKRNKIILMSISFIMNILVIFIFIYKAIVQLQLPYSATLLLDSTVFLLAYGIGIAEIYVIDFLCKKVNQKAETYGENLEKEDNFRGIVTGVVILCSVALVYLFVFIVRY
ncbi:MAG: hypothetical protein AAGU14_07405 [Eubacteriaceae bacterium]